MDYLRRLLRWYLRIRRRWDLVALFVVQNVIGTPEFLFVWTGASIAWMVLNRMGIIKVDPSPFFLLNIVMSEWATFNMPVLTMSDRVISAKADAALAKIEEQNGHIQTLQEQVLANQALIRQQNQTIVEGQATIVQLVEGMRDLYGILKLMVQNVDGDIESLIGIVRDKQGE